MHPTKKPHRQPPHPPVADSPPEGLAAPLRLLDDRLGDGRPFLAGEAPSLADCTLAAALQFARFREVPLPPGHPNVERWDAAYRERPPAREVLVV